MELEQFERLSDEAQRAVTHKALQRRAEIEEREAAERRGGETDG